MSKGECGRYKAKVRNVLQIGEQQSPRRNVDEKEHLKYIEGVERGDGDGNMFARLHRLLDEFKVLFWAWDLNPQGKKKRNTGG